jgi:hypothetical protein
MRLDKKRDTGEGTNHLNFPITLTKTLSWFYDDLDTIDSKMDPRALREAF